LATYFFESVPNLDQAKLRQECIDAGLPVTGTLGGAIGSTSVTVVTSVDLTEGQVATLNAVVAAHDGRPRRTRKFIDVYLQVNALTNAQKDAVIADLQISPTTASSKWTGLKPPQDSPAAVLHWCGTNLAGATAAERRDAGVRIAVMWCQQNPLFLVNPTFHPSLSGVNIPGDEVAV
jgi:hypothetical protein